MINSYHVFCDGGARGNPGPAAIGFLVKDSRRQVLVKKGLRIGETTNNVAEYTAVIKALEWMKDNLTGLSGEDSIDFFLDSKLVVNQLNGLYKIKDSKLRNLVVKVRQLERNLKPSVIYNFIRREKNKTADSLVNGALKSK